MEPRITSSRLSSRMKRPGHLGKPDHVSQSERRTLPNPIVRAETLDEIRAQLGDCKRCTLCPDRKNIVFGQGNPKARLVFVGEGPGADEDAQGLPFVGRAGQLLNKIIEAMGYRREDVYIANIVKCRPPLNRTPTPEEIATCSPFLVSQIGLIQPKVVVALGLTAAAFLTQTQGPISGLRGRFHKIHGHPEIPVMPTYHPAYLLRNPPAKKLVWDDLKIVKEFLENSKGCT